MLSFSCFILQKPRKIIYFKNPKNDNIRKQKKDLLSSLIGTLSPRLLSEPYFPTPFLFSFPFHIHKDLYTSLFSFVDPVHSPGRYMQISTLNSYTSTTWFCSRSFWHSKLYFDFHTCLFEATVQSRYGGLVDTFELSAYIIGIHTWHLATLHQQWSYLGLILSLAYTMRAW